MKWVELWSHLSLDVQVKSVLFVSTWQFELFIVYCFRTFVSVLCEIKNEMWLLFLLFFVGAKWIKNIFMRYNFRCWYTNKVSIIFNQINKNARSIDFQCRLEQILHLSKRNEIYRHLFINTILLNSIDTYTFSTDVFFPNI